MVKLPQCDLWEIVTVNIGNPDETESEELKSLDLLFYDGIEEEIRLESLRTVFKINADDSILRKAKGMHMNLDEQYIEHWKEIGLEQGIQEGIQKGMQEGMQKGMQEGMQKGMQEGIVQGKAEERRKCILLLADSVRAVIEYTGLGLDDAIAMMNVPADMAKDVKAEMSCRYSRERSHGRQTVRQVPLPEGSARIRRGELRGLGVAADLGILLPRPR